MRRPEALLLPTVEHERLLESCGELLTSILRRRLPGTAPWELEIRRLPFPSFRALGGDGPRPTASELEAVAGELSEESSRLGAHAALVEDEADRRRAPQRLAVVGIAWPDERRLRLDVALHDRARERSPRAVARALLLELPDESGALRPTPRMHLVREALEGVQRRFGDALGQLPVDGLDEALRAWSDRPRGLAEGPMRYRWTERSGAAGRCLALTIVARRRLEEERQRWETGCDALLAGLGLDVVAVRGEDDAESGRRLHNRWGLPDRVLCWWRPDIPLTDTLGPTLRGRRGVREPAAVVRSSECDDVGALIDALLERHGVDLPPWLAPVQVAVLPVHRATRPAAIALVDRLRGAGIRARAHLSTERWQSKIRRPVIDRVPWIVVVGDRERDSGGGDLRSREAPYEPGPLGPSELLGRLISSTRPPSGALSGPWGATTAP